VFEKHDRVGGLLRYGIPDFKMEKQFIDRRILQMEAEGVTFRTNAHVGVDVPLDHLRNDFHAILLAAGAEQPRDLNIPGRELNGIFFAMDFLPQHNRRNAGDFIPGDRWISAAGRHVVIIGGGDTGADCLGTCHRQKAASIRQFEIMPLPPGQRDSSTPWPLWPLMLRTESSHEEGGQRHWSILTTRFNGDAHGNVRSLETVAVGPPPGFESIPGAAEEFPADLVLLALGFTGPVKNGLLDRLGVELDARGNVKTGGNSMTSQPGVFAAGDMRRGQSLVVWAIAEGRHAARGIDEYLLSPASLP
jgi:glutamate synthase (NADPH/NADH) small chain